MSPPTRDRQTRAEIAIRAKGIGRVVDARMRELNLSARQLGDIAEVDANAVSSIRKGEARHRQRAILQRLSGALGWPENALVRVQDGALDPDSLSTLVISDGWVRASYLRDVAQAARDLARLAERAARSLETTGSPPDPADPPAPGARPQR
jgi:transcriptional regulator with XRE-family HTH domain